MSCDKNGVSPTTSPRRSPKASKKNTPSKSTTHHVNNNNNNNNQTNDIGPRFGHNTFTPRDLNSTFAGTTTNAPAATSGGTMRPPPSYKERKSVDPASLQNHHNEMNGGKHNSTEGTNTDTSGIHKTGEFFRNAFNQTLSHIKKTKNNNSGANATTSKNLKPVREHEPSVPEAIVSATVPNYADVGFDTYNNSNSSAKNRSKSLPAHRHRKNSSNSQEKSNNNNNNNSNSNHEQGKQLQNLERHHEAISSNSKTTVSKSAELLANELNTRLHSSSSTGSSLSTDSASTKQSVDQLPPSYAAPSSPSPTSDLSLCIPELVELMSDDDMYFQQGMLSNCLYLCTRNNLNPTGPNAFKP